MRTTSAAAAKGSPHSRRIHPQDRPAEGTQIRALYDLLVDHKGTAVDLCTTDKKIGPYLGILQDIWGLDIRRISKNRWALVGEWFGRVYVDYTVVEDRP